MDNASEFYAQLAEPFPQEMERVIVKSGVELIYLPVSEVINRLNRALGVDNWSFEIISVSRDAVDQDEIIAHISLTALINGKTVVKHGFGGLSVKRSKRDNRPVDLGNDFKGAVSDALKKAAQLLGIGLYLARTTDAMDIDEAMHAGESGQVQQAPLEPVSPEIEKLWDSFLTATKLLSKSQKDDLNAFWADYSGGRPKPTKATAKADDINALINKSMELSLGAVPVNTDE
jgi:hypothetical protein